MSEQAALEIPVFDIRIEPEDLRAVEETLRSGWLSAGPRTEEFESAFAEHLGARHVLAVSSGTAALHLACLGAGVGPGDEVIVPSQTFVATANAVAYCGGDPVFADIAGPQDLNLDPSAVEAAITERTKAVIVVHYAGYAADVRALTELCEKHGLTLIEDAAHAPSATSAGRKLGTFGLAGCFSFFSNKVMPCGEGGALSTDSDEVAEQARLLRSQAMTATTRDRHLGRAMAYDVVGLGFNYRLDDPRGALLGSRLARLDADIDRRRELVHRYRGLLAEVEGLIVPYRDEEVDTSSCYMMGILTADPERRDPVRRALRDEHGIQTTIYPAVHELSVYRRRYPDLVLPNSERVARSLFSIPLFPHMDDATQDRVVGALREVVAG
ncbi:MAG: DegT/DnrJ/EryC1/StrS family aminotransferase [Solirubrobacterales bacterium]